MKELKLFAFMFLLIGINSHVSGQRLVTGRLIDKATRKPVKEARVRIIGVDAEVGTNVLGFFQLEINGQDQLIIYSLGYGIVRAKVPEANNFTIEMEKSDYQPNKEDLEELGFQSNSEKAYFDEFGFPSDKSDAKSYRIVIQHPVEHNKFLAKEYDLSDRLIQTGTYSDKEIWTKAGYFTLFHPNGQKREEGFYNDNVETGKWIKWYKNGKLQEEGFYKNSKDIQEFRIDSFFDSLGNQLIANGNGEYIVYEEEPLSYSKGLMRNGLKTGKWLGYNKDGKVVYEEEYVNNKLKKGISFDSLRREYIYTDVFDSDAESFYQFLGTNIKYPLKARRNGVQGQVLIQIIVGPDGRILRSRIAKGFESECDDEALRVVRIYDGRWNIGKKRGQPIKLTKPHSFYLPISFKLAE